MSCVAPEGLSKVDTFRDFRVDSCLCPVSRAATKSWCRSTAVGGVTGVSTWAFWFCPDHNVFVAVLLSLDVVTSTTWLLAYSGLIANIWGDSDRPGSYKQTQSLRRVNAGTKRRHVSAPPRDIQGVWNEWRNTCFPASSALIQCPLVNPDSITQLSLVLNLPLTLLFFAIVLPTSDPESSLFQPVRYTPIYLV
jgi:hypothetical protein